MSFGADGQWVAIGWLHPAKGCQIGPSMRIPSRSPPAPEMEGRRLRSLTQEPEKAGTDLCVLPALLDVAGPQTTIRPTAGLTLPHVDHPRLIGFPPSPAACL
jgi:hypothetical protein